MQAPSGKNPTIFLMTAIRSQTDARVFGWLESLEKARQAAQENSLDMSEENYYTHLVIEEMSPGIHCQVQNEWWYSWLDGHWQACPKPDWAQHTTNWSIG